MIKVGIFGYGNLGKGVECAVSKNKDMGFVRISDVYVLSRSIRD